MPQSRRRPADGRMDQTSSVLHLTRAEECEPGCSRPSHYPESAEMAFLKRSFYLFLRSCFVFVIEQ
jgi:hypothetical protein